MARRGLFSSIARLFGGKAGGAATATREAAGRTGATATAGVTPPARNGLRISYAPDPDGDPDAGEIVWTWVPYVENDGRGKDRPVLVIGRQSRDRVYAVRLTSRSHDGDRDFLAIGAGPWDSQQRPSWIDIEQLYSVHAEGMRREAAALDRERFSRVADALHRRYGWAVGG
ncbi:MAG TPA: type II toxin-antitoxin system PemK/MazF family toxin [Microbacterium sp.]|uniref:type II toxin-antitoxin system PemK/MazF family toxin n=1 Tax=Microbacterium sp. TaxID=51671 RepID=UPI002C159382|nr:type II toxin-antitoxin system PemK/MazF family toxin [Microbacterium sp.]HWI30195.1 type II toxin-antitoxin system PemK/MazF family toxin [Microbacterium sp.]